MRKHLRFHHAALLLASSIAASAHAAPFSSGSTGADGPFAPSCSPTPCTVTQPLPANGIFNYTTVTIPAGVTVRYNRNAANTPVIILATGDVTIAGAVDISGGAGITSGPGTTGDRSLPGEGGPGGHNGGRGGAIQVDRRGGNGLGPGAGAGAEAHLTCCSGRVVGGGGAGYGIAGSPNPFGATAGNTGLGGPAYGTNLLVPLIGGSGGGGGAGGAATNGFHGTGGGGGAGAILIASSGTVTLTGSINANGGAGGAMLFASGHTNSVSTGTLGGTGGGGSGGSIRIVAAQFTGAGALNVNGGGAGPHSGESLSSGGPGAAGRTSVQVLSTGTLSLGGVPTLSIATVAGVTAPATPTGTGDVSIPGDAPNPATVEVTASGVPVGNTVSLRLTPFRGAAITATSAPLAGSVASSTATASITIPQGISTLSATASYTITVAMGEMLRQYAEGERVEKVELVASYGGPSTARLITASGRAFEVPAEVLRSVSIGG